MNRVGTIAIGTAAGIMIAIGISAALFVGSRKVHSFNQGKISSEYKQKFSDALTTYDKLSKMDAKDPAFHSTVETFHLQEMRAVPVTEHEQWISSKLSDLYIHQDLRPSSNTEEFCKPVPKGHEDECTFYASQDQATLNEDKLTYAHLKDTLKESSW
jgi:hypothetical protein